MNLLWLQGHCLGTFASAFPELGWKACTATPSCILMLIAATGCSLGTKWHHFVFSVSQHFEGVQYTVGFYLRLTSLSCDKIVQISSWLPFSGGGGSWRKNQLLKLSAFSKQASFFYFGCEHSREPGKKLNNSSNNNKGGPNAMFQKPHSLVLDDGYVEKEKTADSRQRQNYPRSSGNVGWVRRKSFLCL